MAPKSVPANSSILGFLGLVPRGLGSAIDCRRLRKRSSKGGFLARFWQNLAIAEGTKIGEKTLFFDKKRFENGVGGEKKTKFGRHAESIGPGVSKQGFGSPKMSQRNQKDGPRGVRKATLHSEGTVLGMSGEEFPGRKVVFELEGLSLIHI